MRGEARTDLVVVTHESRSDLERSLELFAAAALRAGGRVIVADNASTDGTLEVVDSLGAEHVEALPLRRNRGYAAAVNAAAVRSDARYLTILNPDVELPADAAAALARHLADHPGAGAAVPRLVNRDGSVQTSARVVPTLPMLVARQTLLGETPWGRRVSARYLVAPDAERGHVPVEWALGAAMCVRRADFDRLGGWDERFFLYFEDVDFCVRLAGIGQQVHYLPDLRVVHAHEQSSMRGKGSLISSRSRRTHVASALRFFAKHPRYAFRRV